jgi:hypothetical protein
MKGDFQNRSIDDQGNRYENMGGTFDLCASQDRFINQRVNFEYGPVRVNGCQGLEPCAVTRLVTLITEMTVPPQPGIYISWEFIFSFILPHRFIQRIIDISWFLLDTVILAQFLKYGFNQFPYLSKLSFYMAFVVTLITSFCTVLFVSVEFHDWHGVYAAFGQNLLMSILFITMLYQRQSLQGQSIGIAVCKLVGTLFASLAFYLYADISQDSILLPFCYIAIFIYDLTYVSLLIKQQRSEIAQDLTRAEIL